LAVQFVALRLPGTSTRPRTSLQGIHTNANETNGKGTAQGSGVAHHRPALARKVIWTAEGLEVILDEIIISILDLEDSEMNAIGPDPRRVEVLSLRQMPTARVDSPLGQRATFSAETLFRLNINTNDTLLIDEEAVIEVHLRLMETIATISNTRIFLWADGPSVGPCLIHQITKARRLSVSIVST